MASASAFSPSPAKSVCAKRNWLYLRSTGRRWPTIASISDVFKGDCPVVVIESVESANTIPMMVKYQHSVNSQGE
jgi:hypothetical protein